jgi:hypothetical protein
VWSLKCLKTERRSYLNKLFHALEICFHDMIKVKGKAIPVTDGGGP